MSSSQNSRVIDPSGISYAVTNGHKDGEPKIIEPIGCAMRGHNPENPSERGRSNGKYKQRIEMGSNISNTITSVQKDALVAEPTIRQRPHGFNKGGEHTISPTLTGSAFQENNLVSEPTSACIQIGNIYPDLENMSNRSGGRVYSKEGCSPTILSRDFKTPKLIADTKPDECRLVGGSWDGWQDDRVFDIEGSSPTLDTNSEKRPRIQGDATSYRIRKLTPRECFRLMGVSETNIDKIQQSGVSQSQQYKMAGNSIVVDCLYHLFRKMLTETHCESQQLSLF